MKTQCKEKNKNRSLRLNSQVNSLQSKLNNKEIELRKYTEQISLQIEEIQNLKKDLSLYKKEGKEKTLEIISYWLNLIFQVITICLTTNIIDCLCNEKTIGSPILWGTFSSLVACVFCVWFRDSSWKEKVPARKMVFMTWDGLSFYALSLLINFIYHGNQTKIETIGYRLVYTVFLIPIALLLLSCIAIVKISEKPKTERNQKLLRGVLSILLALIILAIPCIYTYFNM